MFRRKTAAQTKTYGGDKTIHRTKHLDVEVHNGRVVAVWFRCMQLPFEEHKVDARRAAEMTWHGEHVQLHGVEIAYPDEGAGVLR